MGAKFCKRGSYDLEKDFKSYNKLERRAISFISLSASEIYGDIIQDYYRSQSVSQLHEVVTVRPREARPDLAVTVTKRNKLTRSDRLSAEEPGSQFHTIQDHRPSYYTNSSDNDIFYDALEYYDTISFTTDFDNAVLATLVPNTDDPVHQSVKHRNSSQSTHTVESKSVEWESSSEIPSKEEDQVNLHFEDSIPKKILHSTPDILIHSLGTLEQPNYEGNRFIQVTVEKSTSEEIVHCHDMVEIAKNGTSNNAEPFTRVAPEVEKAGDFVEVTEYRPEQLNDSQDLQSVPSINFTEDVTLKPDSCAQSKPPVENLVSPEVAKARELEEEIECRTAQLDDSQDRSVNSSEDVTSKPAVCGHSNFTTEPQIENSTKWIAESDNVSQLKLIMQEVNRLKTQIDGGIDYVNCFQNLMKVMMDVNAIKNEDFDEEVFLMQNEALAEIRACLGAVKLKTENR